MTHQERKNKVSAEPALKTGREENPDNLQIALRNFRNAVHAAAERPDNFWEIQRSAIAPKLGHPVSTAGWRSKLAWASAAMIGLVCYIVYTERNATPTYAFAAGYDQNLLIEVERALNKNYPDALAPADLLSREIERENSRASLMEPESGIELSHSQ